MGHIDKVHQAKLQYWNSCELKQLKQSENQLFKPPNPWFKKKKKRNSEPTLYNQLLKLIWECGLSLTGGAFKNGNNALDVGQ